MKIKTMLLVLLFSMGSVFGEPLLVVVLMVKNEASVITQTLQPYVDGGVKDFVVFDTGSTDGTQDIARDFFRDHGIDNAYIVEEPFVDFATSRNRALDTAGELFPDATFMLMPDAEWYMHGAEGLLQYCREHENDFCDAYLVSIRSTALAFYVSRLIRAHRDVHFVGAVHEVLNKGAAITLPYDVYFEWRPAQRGQEKSAQRWKRDVNLLLKSYQQNPFDTRTLFYLAQTYECLGDYENAYTFYTKRAELVGWPEEDFITRLRLGGVAQHLTSPDDAGMCPRAVRHYLEAFSMRPCRAESLINLAQYYVNKDQMQLAFLFATRAVQIPYPTTDILFVEKYHYDFVRYELLGRCAWYVGEYALGEWAMKKALEVKPEEAYLQRNLKFYTDRRDLMGS